MADVPVLSGAVIDDRHTYEAPGVEVDEICGWCPALYRATKTGHHVITEGVPTGPVKAIEEVSGG